MNNKDLGVPAPLPTQNVFDTLTAELASLDASHKKVLEDIQSIQAEWDTLGVCPTCAQPCSADHSLAV